MKKFYVLGVMFLTSFMLVGGCVTIDYSMVSVPQEGGIKMTKITNDSDAPAHPYFSDNGAVMDLRMLALSNDGTKIAYVGNKDNKFNIFVKSLSGGGYATVQRTFFDNVVSPYFSPDGKNIVFCNFADGNIYMVNSTGGAAVRQITNGETFKKNPVFNASGNQIYYQVSAGGGSSIWSCDLSNSSFSQYVSGYYPTCGKTPNKILMERDNAETGHSEIWLFDTNDSSESVIATDKNKDFNMPALSPDGKRVAYCAQATATGGIVNFDIFVMNVDGTHVSQLTFHPGNDICPVWSADGNDIYWLSQRGTTDGAYNIWRMAVKGNESAGKEDDNQ